MSGRNRRCPRAELPSHGQTPPKLDPESHGWQPDWVGAGFHTPVLAEEVCGALGPALANAEAAGSFGEAAGILVDATCGGGGHTLRLLGLGSVRQVLAFDRDADALAHAAGRFEVADCPVRMFHAPFSAISEKLAALDIPGVSAIIADLGVSSHQLDTADRGFSIRREAALDMRMDRSLGRPLAEMLEELDEAGLARILKQFGEEPDAGRIARAILKVGPKTTTELATTIESAMSARQRRALGRRIHPATRTFQALRIWVNGELDELDRFLARAPELLLVGGRIGVITFHSLEDLRVRSRFRQLCRPPSLPRGLPLQAREVPRPRFSTPKGYRSGQVPSADECERNPRARSARLRVLERTCP